MVDGADKIHLNGFHVRTCGRCEATTPESRMSHNRLADIEWNTPVGEAKACGGDAMIRVEAFRQVDGFNQAVIAGEEPELCVRLRQRGWRILRIVAEMSRLGQWWHRSVRAGHAYAEGVSMHGKPPERHGVRESRGNCSWGLILPLMALGLAWPTRGASLMLLTLYAVLAYRIYRGARSRGMPPKDARAFAAYCCLGKLPQALGQAKYALGRAAGRRSGLIEYKGPTPKGPTTGVMPQSR